MFVIIYLGSLPGVADPGLVEGMPTMLAWNRWRRAWLVALAQVTYPQVLTRLD
ncbi:MAG: hypothetical protein ACKOS8_09410 [Gemmataceae bacterium]